ncbi:hypothetical protein [Singulisphaera sp. PoT]|uniref:hypothetical protein n=1 Tax=Singulisphaera sp. PoT TaxID=3411797 RepID=UPI003BF4B170
MRSSPTSSSCTPPYESGRIPAARCNASNLASRATLQKAGMSHFARVLTGAIAPKASGPGS